MVTQPKNSLSILFLLTGCILLLPFAALAFYNVPSSDDFLYAKFQWDSGTVSANLACYFGWGGRYVSNLLLTACNPLSYSRLHSNYLLPYQFHSLVMLAFLVISAFHLTTRVLERRTFSFSLLITGLILFFLRDTNELLYWMAGSYTYCYGLSFALMSLFYLSGGEKEEKERRAFRLSDIPWRTMAGLFILLALGVARRKALLDFLNPRPGLFLAFLGLISVFLIVLPFFHQRGALKTTTRYLLTAACGFLAVGSNEIYAFILLPFFGVLTLNTWISARKFTWEPLALMAIGILAAGLNLFAPSTFARRNLQTQAYAPFDWSDAGQWQAMLGYFGFIPGLAALILFLQLSLPGENSQESRRGTFSPALETAFWVLSLVFILLAIPLGLTLLTGPLPDRARNPLAIVAVFPILILGRRLLTHRPGLISYRWIFLVAGLVWTAAVFRPLTWWEAVRFISSGVGEKSLTLHKERFSTIENCVSDTCYISRNPYHSGILFNVESATLDTDPPSWKNYKSFSYAAYFEKKSIIAR